MEKFNHNRRNIIIFILIIVNTILISSYFYKKTRAEPVVMQILNGCGEPGVAAQFADRLHAFTVLRVDNADRFDIQLTRLEYHHKPVRHSLEPLLEILNLPEGRLFFTRDDTTLINVSLIIGKDYNQILAGMKPEPEQQDRLPE